MKPAWAVLSVISTTLAAADWGPAERLPDAVNSPYYDWGVCATADGNTIYFSSNRGNPSSYACDIYRARRAGSSWTPAQKVPGPINTADHEGAPCLTWDGRRMYFHRGKLGTPEGDIWASDWTGSGWGNPYKIPGQVNRADKWESNPAISPDGRTLYFVGEYWPGNQAVYNVWASRWTGSEWGEPWYLSGINTAGNEGDAAFTYGGQYLYFWSGRNLNVSRIYRAENVGGEWRNAEELGSNVNAPGNYQTDPLVTKDGRYLFFARDPYGEALPDIYVSRWCEPAVAPSSFGKIKAMYR
jgi:Tol biopolymer transport system component